MTSHAAAIDRQTLADGLLKCGPWHCLDDDQALIDHATAQARAVEIDAAELDHEKALALAIHRVTAHHIEPPNEPETGQLKRLACSNWWRRQLRRLTSRRREQRQRVLGRVHDRAGIYVSHEGYKRRRAQQFRNQAMLEAVTAINELDQSYTLAELAELGLANPDNRRAELMLRIADTEREAVRLGHVGLFLTITAPSRFHAVHKGTARVNSKWERDGRSTPRQAQDYLQRLWGKARSFLGRRNLGTYGIRVVEPHHDGCPHWHLLLWCEPQNVAAVLGVMRSYALEDSPGEVTKDETVRFDAKLIDPAKGSAAGYVLKYVTKNINGKQYSRQGVEGDHLDAYGHDLQTSAPRIEAWAACWGIRQFQFFGLPSVTVWRQTRKIREATDLLEWLETYSPDPATASLMGQLWKACDAGEWAEFLRLMGGPMTRRDDQPVKPWTIERLNGKGNGELQTGAYGDVKQSIIGVVVNGFELMTQQHFWRVEQTPKSGGFDLEGLTFDGEAITRTRVNNSTQPEYFKQLLRSLRLQLSHKQHTESALNDWEWHKTQDFRRRFPVADPATVAELRHQVRIDVERDEIHRAMRDERERLEAQRKATIEEGQHLVIGWLARGEMDINDLTPQMIEALTA
ncbi:replication endonuclease [Vreelandella sulfidaeris]|uniref:replication endonuclease n=1 Tax=Vreelandella sulfidaeris TaxID=115553 RepID=UPI0035E8E176